MKKLIKWFIVIVVLLLVLLLWGLLESPYRCVRIAEHYPILQAWCGL